MTAPEHPVTTVARAMPPIRMLLLRSLLTVGLTAVILFVVGLFWAPVRITGFVALIGFVAYSAYVTLYLRRALIEFGAGGYRVREAISDVRFTARDATLVVPVDELVLPGQTGPALVVIGKTQRRLLEINAATFGTPALESLATDLIAHGVPVDHVTGRVAPAEFEKRHPRVLSWAALHPVGLSVILTVSVVIVTAISATVAALAA